MSSYQMPLHLFFILGLPMLRMLTLNGIECPCVPSLVIINLIEIVGQASYGIKAMIFAALSRHLHMKLADWDWELWSYYEGAVELL